MKKIFALMALLCAVLVAGVSCNDKKPDVKYQLDVEGLVANQSTPISAEFKAFVCNTDSIKIVASRNVSTVDQALIEASLDKPASSNLRHQGPAGNCLRHPRQRLRPGGQHGNRYLR